MPHSICLITADVLSGHTYKRAKFLAKHFEVSVVGFTRMNKKGDSSLLSEVSGKIVAEVEDRKYWKRAGNYIQLVRALRSRKPAYVWARGADMMLVALLYKWLFSSDCRVLSEITDVYASSYEGRFASLFLRFEKWLFSHAYLTFATSSAFFDFYNITPRKQVLWENFIPFEFDEEQRLNLGNRKAQLYENEKWLNVNWTGYLRCRFTLDNMVQQLLRDDCKFRLHLFGYPNGGDVTNEYLEQLQSLTSKVKYFGAYRFPDDLPSIFSSAHFTIVSEKGKHNKDSTLCLSNRIYESASNYTPCISVGESAISRYIVDRKLGLAFPSFEDLGDFMAGMTTDKYKEIYQAVDFSGFARYQKQKEEQLNALMSSMAGNGPL